MIPPKKSKATAEPRVQTIRPPGIPSAAKMGTPTVHITSTAEASASDLDEKVKQLEERLDKQRGEQSTLIISVLVAGVFLIFAVVAEILIFNATFNDSLDKFKDKQNDDMRRLENLEIQNQQNLNNTLLMQLRGPATTPSPE